MKNDFETNLIKFYKQKKTTIYPIRTAIRTLSNYTDSSKLSKHDFKANRTS